MKILSLSPHVVTAHARAVGCKNLIKAAKSNGCVSVSCPGLKCTQRLCKRDCAHMLLEESNCDESAVQLIDLMRFRMENCMIGSHAKYKYCQTAGCAGVMSCNKSYNKRLSNCKGADIQICSCGASLCLQCHEKSHVGFTCSEAKSIEKELSRGTLFGEALSHSWIESHTSPCPKCSFRITKNGGCNHMRCGKCSYYFCWICGQDGEDCGSYRCRKKNITFAFGSDTQVDSRMGTEDRNLRTSLQLLKKLSEISSKLNETVIKSVMSTDLDPISNTFYIHLLQQLVWSITLSLHESNKNMASTTQSFSVSTEKLIFLHDVISDEVEIDIKREYDLLVHPKQRAVSKKKKISKQSIQEEKRQEKHSLVRCHANDIITILSLQSLDEKSLKNQAYIVFSEMQKGLILATRGQSRNDAEDMIYKNTPLNQRGKLLKKGWKNTIQDDEERDDETLMRKKSSNRKWKGKNIVSTLRCHAIDKHAL